MSKTKIIISVIIILIIIIGLYYVLRDNNSIENTTNTIQTPNTNIPNSDSTTVPPAVSSSPKPITENVPSEISINIKNFSFVPSTISIKKGTKVTWTNSDTAPHTVTSDSGSLLDSGTIAPGQSFSFTFNNSGLVNYHCTIHPMMKASVVVEK